MNENKVLLMSQMPNGSIPILNTLFTNDTQRDLDAYRNFDTYVHFYFPAAGKFQHPPSNVSLGKKVISLSAKHELEVGKTIKITKVQTFQDLMYSIKGQANKKAEIIRLLETKEDLTTDKTFKFEMGDTGLLWLFGQDLEFYFNFMRVYERSYPYDKDLYRVAYK